MRNFAPLRLIGPQWGSQGSLKRFSLYILVTQVTQLLPSGARVCNSLHLRGCCFHKPGVFAGMPAGVQCCGGQEENARFARNAMATEPFPAGRRSQAERPRNGVPSKRCWFAGVRNGVPNQRSLLVGVGNSERRPAIGHPASRDWRFSLRRTGDGGLRSRTREARGEAPSKSGTAVSTHWLVERHR